MKNIEKKVLLIVKREKQKYKEIDKLIKDIDEMYPREKPSYNLPLVDTIGMGYYKNRIISF